MGTKEVKLKDLMTVLRNGANIKQFENAKGLPITRIETISNAIINPLKVGYANIFDDKYRDYYLQEGDILLSHINSVTHLGKCAICNRTAGKLIHGMNLLMLRANKTLVWPKYLYYVLNSKRFKRQLPKITKKSVNQASITVTDIGNISLIIEKDVGRQKRIAERLDKVQELIALQKEQLTKLDDLIKSRFIDIFGDPITNPKGLLQKSMDEISLELFAGGDREQDLAKVPQGEYKYPVYSNGETRKGLLGYSKHYRVDKKAITISARGTIGFLAIREPFFTPVVRLITVVPKENINIVYLKYMLQCIKLVSSGTSQGQLTVPDFKRIKILLDSKNKQDNFADFVTKIEAQKGLLTARLSHLETLYKSLMQEYFG